jgi:class 3 adenylate cyclase/DNA polymerase III delta prime subunit
MTHTGGQVDTRSVLFTDLVGSTELRVHLGEEQADAMRRRHDDILTATITANAGTVVKGLGDGLMATFAAAADAVAAAVAIQQAVYAEPFEIRIGLSIGDVNVEDGDVFGVPVVEASRLCAIATAGEILAAELVRALARGRGGFVFEPMGDLDLKGLPEPVAAARVIWEPLIDTAATDDGGDGVPIPAALLSGISASYVGRPALIEKLDEYWRRATEGIARTVLLAGEPGVGKTRTAAELARHVHQQQGLVLYGRCEEGLGAPYQPFVEALDWYTANVPDNPVLGRLPGELARLLPDLVNRVRGLAKPTASDPGSEEHRLFEATTSWLIDLANHDDRGLMLVLDDLHWATKPTLLLVLHLLRAASEQGARLLVVVTYRDTDIDRAHPLSGVLADLRRLPTVERAPVDNLTADEVVALMETAAGHTMDEAGLALAEAVYAETEGNPFFITEVLRHLIETGGIRREGERWVPGDAEVLTIPEGVRDVVGRRLSRLSPQANEVLSSGAVMGRELDVGVLVALSDGGEDVVLDALDEAVRARLVEEVGVDRFRFAHALVQTTLYDELSATRRRRLHRRTADVIEKLRPTDVVALAYHCDEGGPVGGDVSRAVRYGLAAAEQSLAGRAFADAEVRFLHVLDQLEDAEEADPPERVAALVGLGEAQRDQGNRVFRDTLLDAARRALELGNTPLLVRAVLSNSRGISSIVGDVDPEVIEMIEAALAAVAHEPSADRARLLAHLAAEVTFAGDNSRRLALTDEAEAMARELGDPAVVAWVIVHTGYSAVVPHAWERNLVRSEEGARLADATGDPTLRALARVFWSAALIFAGRVSEAEQVTAEMVAIAEAEGSPTVRWVARSNAVRFIAARGSLHAAAIENDACLAMAQESGERDGLQWWAATLNAITWARGEGGTLADAAGVFAQQYPLLPAWHSGHAWLLAEDGRFDEARAVLRAHNFGPRTLVDESLPLIGLFQLAYVTWLLDDAELAGLIVDELARYVGRWPHYYLATFGPVTWSLGLVKSVLGAHDEAVMWMDDALAHVAAAGFVNWVTMGRIDLAQILMRRGGPGDDERARTLLTTSRAEGIANDTPGVVARIDALQV